MGESPQRLSSSRSNYGRAGRGSRTASFGRLNGAVRACSASGDRSGDDVRLGALYSGSRDSSDGEIVGGSARQLGQYVGQQTWVCERDRVRKLCQRPAIVDLESAEIRQGGPIAILARCTPREGRVA